MPAILVQNISKTYDKGKILAVDNLSFQVEEGELFGLIGPDGAGKTSVLRILTTLLLADKGSATVTGLNVADEANKIRQHIGYMPGKFSLYTDLTVEENLHFFATLFNTTVEANYSLIKDIYEQLAPFRKRRSRDLSGGMKQKLALCCALIHKPKVLFLDEPTTGVDPVSRKEFWEMLKTLKAQNMTILVSTPYMDEALLCDRIALMQNGKFLTIDTPTNITAAYPHDLFAVKSSNMAQLLKVIHRYSDKQEGYAFGEYAHVSFSKQSKDTETIYKYFTQQGILDAEVIKIEPNIEDCFIHFLNPQHE